MYKGSCLCGCINYQVSSFEGPFMFCHCSRCRKASGSAFASNAVIKTENLQITQGKQYLKFYKTTAGVSRSFCGECGSPIYSQKDYEPGILRLRLGTLDTPLKGVIKPQAHLFVASKAEWDSICDNLPQFAEFPNMH